MPQAYSISGTVTDGSGTPIVGAMVSAFRADSILPAYDDTGADGRYSISLTWPGDYLVMAQASGFVPEYYNNVYDQNLATEVTVTFSGRTGIDFTLGPAGSISGVVENEAGDPLHYAKVKAQGDDFTTYDYTGADGTYEVNGLTPGSYVVWAQASGYITEYYNNVSDSSSATPVAVAALTDTPNVDFTLGNAPNFPRWDINQDAEVDYKDLAMLGAAYATATGGPGFNPDADLNQDGVIDYKDLSILGAHYGETY